MMRGIILLNACIASLCNCAAAQNNQFKRALRDECTNNELASGTYQVVIHTDQYAFLVNCLVDGTMYLDAQYLALFHHYQTIGTVLEFDLLLAAEYNTIDDVDESVLSVERMHFPYPFPKVNAPASAQIDDDSLQDEELTTTQKKSVNMAAQYIVYGVIIAMAAIFSMGICILMYWWFCRKYSMRADTATKLQDCAAGTVAMDEAQETTPFIDIRGADTIKQQLHKQRNHNRQRRSRSDSDHDDDLLQRGRQNIYDDIDGADEDEDGDDLIAHYGATNDTDINANGSGYVIAARPAP